MLQSICEFLGFIFCKQNEKSKIYRPRFIGKMVITFTFFFTFIFLLSCKKIVSIDPPIDSITTSQTYSTDANATSSVLSIYSKMASILGFGTGASTIFCGLAADELNYYLPDIFNEQFYTNSIPSNSGVVSSSFWSPAYFSIYQANSGIENLESNSNVTPNIKKQLLGECKFIRAYCYFLLVNLFGDVPLVTSTNWNETSNLSRAPKADIYGQIVEDLQDAGDLLVDNYSFSSHERTRPNKWAANALLARVYLFNGEWNKAEIEATLVLDNSSLFVLEHNLNDVFKNISKEAIWQIKPSETQSPFATWDGNFILPSASGRPGFFYIDSFLNSIESGDIRKLSWVGITTYQGATYYYPNKYKVKRGTPGNIINEYYTLIRLSELYLICAEAKAQQDKFNGAIEDLNKIRNRAMLNNLPLTLSKPEILLAVEQERRIELSSESGHRWFDLLRTNRANNLLPQLKGGFWQITDQLFPLPMTEIQKNPNLIQNPGY